MNEKNIRLVTAESVRAGHPDKFCDQIADAILDAHLAQDPSARVAVEVFATNGKLIIGGEVSSRAKVDCGEIVADAIDRIGYTMRNLCANPKKEFKLELRLHRQSPDIAAAVDQKIMGAGDQGVVVGYATDETPEYLPLPVVLAHRICRTLDEQRPNCAWMGVDGKAQVTVAYENDKPVAVAALVVSIQHGREINRRIIERFVRKEVLDKVIPRELLKEDTRVLVNSSGTFVRGGPAADTGLTGRKLAVDQYGPVAHIGGGALSGKDPTKVDRSGAYAARWIAKNIVAAGMAKRCEVQIAYAIGRSEPVSVTVDCFGTGVLPDSRIEAAVKEAFDLTPAGIIRDLRLTSPIYSGLSCYGHFGRTDLCAPWEETNRKYDLLSAALPSGRNLCYQSPHFTENRFGSDAIGYYAPNAAGQMVEQETFGGKLAENATQAIARDILGHAMLNLEAAGYPIVFHVHDEAIMEVPIGKGSLEEACRIMAIPPGWAKDLPLRADGDEMLYYQKA